MLVGIDLGTSNSLIGTLVDGKPKLIPNAFGSLLTPSVVGMDDTGALRVGAPTRDRLIANPHLTAASFKRDMCTQQEFDSGPRRFRPEGLAAMVLTWLKQDAEACLGTRIAEATNTVPAYFNDAQRKATIAAGK